MESTIKNHFIEATLPGKQLLFRKKMLYICLYVYKNKISYKTYIHRHLNVYNALDEGSFVPGYSVMMSSGRTQMQYCACSLFNNKNVLRKTYTLITTTIKI